MKWTAAGRLSDWDHHLKPFYDNAHNPLQNPVMHHVLEDLSIVGLSHSLDGMLLHAPRRIATAGVPVTGIWDGMVELCSEALCAYIDRIGADAASSKIIFECHGAQRIHPVSCTIPMAESKHLYDDIYQSTADLPNRTSPPITVKSDISAS